MTGAEIFHRVNTLWWQDPSASAATNRLFLEEPMDWPAAPPDTVACCGNTGTEHDPNIPCGEYPPD
jgi:hypothetical protein